MSSEVPLELRDALSTFVARERIVVATDFDGVLSPLVLDPLAAQPLPGTIDALRALASSAGCTVAVVSGRDLETLRALTGLTDESPIQLIGSHGAQRSGTSAVLTPDQARLLAHLTAQAHDVCARNSGARVETKPTAVVVHTRGVDDDVAQSATAAAQALGEQDGVHVKSGKSVVELTVVAADKGSAVTELARSVEAQAILYLGDDVTDEDVFTLLGPGDVGVKVGDGPTRAQWRVDSPIEVAAVLTELVARRAL